MHEILFVSTFQFYTATTPLVRLRSRTVPELAAPPPRRRGMKIGARTWSYRILPLTTHHGGRCVNSDYFDQRPVCSAQCECRLHNSHVIDSQWSAKMAVAWFLHWTADGAADAAGVAGAWFIQTAYTYTWDRRCVGSELDSRMTSNISLQLVLQECRKLYQGMKRLYMTTSTI